MPTKIEEKVDKLEERLRKIENFVTELFGRADSSSKETDVLAKDIKILRDLATKVAVIEERLNEFKKNVEEIGRRRWLLWPSMVGGVIGALAAFLGQLALSYLTRK